MSTTWRIDLGDKLWQGRVKLILATMALNLLAVSVLVLAPPMSLPVQLAYPAYGLLFLPVMGASLWLTIRLLRSEHQWRPIRSTPNLPVPLLRLFEYVDQHPGTSFGRLSRAMNWGPNIVQAQLGRIVESGHIVIRRQFGRWRLYSKDPKDGRLRREIDGVVLQILRNAPATVQQLVQVTGLSARVIRAEVQKLEKIGLVARLDDATYRVCDGLRRNGPTPSPTKPLRSTPQSYGTESNQDQMHIQCSPMGPEWPGLR